MRLFEAQRPTLHVGGTFLCHFLVAARMKGREKKEAAFCLLLALTLADQLL